jgi:uncharacterized protein YeaO (DUF488 family)
MDARPRRAYEPAAQPSEDDRVLIDRIWPRGVTREEAHVDEWARELALSGKSRWWLGHDPGRFEEFGQRNTEELAAQKRKFRELRSCAGEGTLRLVYGARDTEHNDAVALAEILRRRRRWR